MPPRCSADPDGVVAAPAKLVEARPACICDPLGGTHMMGCPAKLVEAHCERCGSTDSEDLYTGDQGYSACCNEPVILY